MGDHKSTKPAIIWVGLARSAQERGCYGVACNVDADYWGSEPDGIRLDLLAANTLDLKTFERLKQTIGA